MYGLKKRGANKLSQVQGVLLFEGSGGGAVLVISELGISYLITISAKQYASIPMQDSQPSSSWIDSVWLIELRCIFFCCGFSLSSLGWSERSRSSSYSMAWKMFETGDGGVW